MEDVLRIIFSAVLALSAIVVIVTVLLQEGSRQGLGSIAGGAETFFGKNKAKSFEGKIVLSTKIAASLFIAMALLISFIGAPTTTNADVSLREVLLPENMTIVPGKTFEEYTISWEPSTDVSEYMFSGFRDVEAGGSIHPQDVSESLIYSVEGTQSEVDLVAVVNEFCAMDNEKILIEDEEVAIDNIVGYYISVLIITKSGEPIFEAIELPFDLTGI